MTNKQQLAPVTKTVKTCNQGVTIPFLPPKKVKYALCVGRTYEDYLECAYYKHVLGQRYSLHLPAPSGLLKENWREFGGTIFCTHTQKPWSDIACSVELKSRVVDSIQRGGRHIIGAIGGNIGGKAVQDLPDEYLQRGEASPILCWPHRDGQPHDNSGLFMVYAAATLGYDPIYIAGIDFGTIAWTGRGGLVRDWYAMRRWVQHGEGDAYQFLPRQRDYFKSLMKRWQNVQRQFPAVTFYKMWEQTPLPIEYKRPPRRQTP